MLAVLEAPPPPALSDADRGAAEHALGELLAAHRTAVAGVLRRRYAGALGAADIDDVVAAASARMWRRVDELPRLRSPRAWFLRVADNVARDVLRYGWHRARQLEVAGDPEWLGSFPDQTRALPEPVAAASPQLVRTLREIVAALPDVQRRIVWADALNPDGPVESGLLAKELGIPPGTVRVYRKRGLDRIRRELEKRDLSPATR